MSNELPHSSGEQEIHNPAGLVPSHGIEVDVPPQTTSDKPPLLHHVSTPTYESPLRHHVRTHSSHRQVKETLNAHSEYTNSQDDGTAQHRLNQYIIKQEIGRGSFGAVHLAVDQYGTEYVKPLNEFPYIALMFSPAFSSAYWSEVAELINECRQAVKEFSKSRLRKRAQSHVLRGPHGGRRRGHLAAGGLNSPLHQHSEEDLQEGVEHSSLWLIKEEIAVMKKLNHNNLVTLIEVLDDPDEDSLYMVMEMCKKGVVMKVGLDEKADPYDNENCRMWFRDMILGIEYLHAQGIVHRDIKPDNCLLTDDEVLKIVDFGVSEIFEKDSEMMTVKSAGSPAFLPPELCVAKHGGISGKAADIWSMGVTLYCLRYGRIPFEQNGIFELYESIRNDHFDCGDEDDKDFRDLMVRILEKDPAKRIPMEDLREHPWVTKGGADPLLSAEENTADLIEPPTEEEMNHAITGNMSNLLVVMKAAKKFQRLIAKRRPNIMESILGGDQPHLVEPPHSIGKHSDSSHLAYKSHSVDAYDRRPLEQTLVTEGVHRQMDLGDRKKTIHPTNKMDPALSISTKSKDQSQGSPKKSEEAPDRDLTASPDTLQPLSHSNTLGTPHPWEQDGNRGHAHDPLEEQLYLRIGPSSFAHESGLDNEDENFADDENMTVSESPGAAEGNIYETAYQQEIERIRSQSKNGCDVPTVYLTRRVEGKKLVGGVGKMVSGILAAKYAQRVGGDAGSDRDQMPDSRGEPSRDTGAHVDKMHAALLGLKRTHSYDEIKESNVAAHVKAAVARLDKAPASETPTETKQSDEKESPPEEVGNAESMSSSSLADTPVPTERRSSAFRGLGRGSFKGLMNKMKGKAR